MSTAERASNRLIISFLTLKPENEEQLEDIEKFVDCDNILLTELKFHRTSPSSMSRIPNFQVRVLYTMKKLLLTSQNTLKILSFEDQDYNTGIINILSSLMLTADRNQSPLVLSQLTLNPETWRQLDDIEKFARCNKIRIEKLELGFSKFAVSSDQDKTRFLNSMRKILSASQNSLKILSFKNDRYTPEIIKILSSVMSTADRNQNPLIISSLNLEPEDMDQLEDIKNFTACQNMEIENLSFTLNCDFVSCGPDLAVRIANIISKLLSTSQTRLKNLYLWDCQHYISRLDLPVMTALTNMHLKFLLLTSDHSPPMGFLLSFRFLEKVPNLQEISIDYSGNRKDTGCFQHLFEETGRAPSVKILKCSGFNLSGATVDLLLRAFPNIEDLNLSMVNCWTETIFTSLWMHGKSLKKLHLSIDLDKFVRHSGLVWSLDSSFTGFAPETVNKIKETPNLDPYKLEELEKLRVGPSILNLKELESLSITFLGWDVGSIAEPLPRRTLAVGAKYGFCLLPKNPRIYINVARYRKGAREALHEVSKLRNVIVKFAD